MMAVRLWAAGVVLVLAGCSVPSLEELRNERTVDVEVSFTFKAGCIVVTAKDVADPAKTESTPFSVFDRGAADRTVAVTVFRPQSWGSTLAITTAAHEQSCTGPVVASTERQVTLDKGSRQRVSVTLSAVDTDGDGFVPTAGGGTDCDDSNANVARLSFYEDGDGDGVGTGTAVQGCAAPSARHVAQGGDCDDTRASVRPGLPEACDGLDNDCQNGVDDGLAGATYYRDADGDTYGAPADSRRECQQPAGYVARAGDCDDGDDQRRPGLAEVCDGKDNNCQNGIDDGLAVNTYYRDADTDTYGVSTDSRQDCRTPAGYVARAGDCNDSAATVNPGATETCNNVDDNCAGGPDEGFDKQWYRDADNDTFGIQSDRVESCSQPAGYVRATATFDCNDGNPSVRPGATELCNNVDDNCVNGADEGFTSGPTAKGAACSTPCPGGTYICSPSGTATTCDSPQLRDYYPDVDGDNAGDENATAQNRCPSAQPPNTVTNRQDCDDRDKYNFRNNAEVCDHRDNNCVNGTDEGNICGGTGWKQLTDTAVTGTRGWNTVALNQASAEGYPVWIAGSNGVLARRASAVETFTSHDTRCGTNHWNAAWVRPSDGRVYLAGSGGRVAEYTGTPPCITYTVNGGSEAMGIIGFETGTPPLTTVILYVVDVDGRLHVWRPQDPVPDNEPDVVDHNAAVYLDVHGFSASRLFLAGRNSGANPPPVINVYTGGVDTSRESIASSSANTSVRAVWMGGTNFAYAVGDSSIAERWNGTGWTSMASTPPSTNFTSVCAPDPSSGYITDAVGNIRRYTGSAWVLHHTAGGLLKDIALVSPTSVWAVGPNGRVIHFPEAP